MAAAQPLAKTQPHLSVVQPDGRAGFGALRAELHARTEDRDLAELWTELATPERKTVLASARMEPRDATRSVEHMAKCDRDAIRAAIGRMSRYAQQLQNRLEESGRPHPSRELAANARRALSDGDTRAVLHWLDLIERGAK
ncbi:hypothetical protein [Salinicola rhizosphaerae]|uniref:Uncharacterized protein n=1 Tax=Salinicola rhizosphaerae TaxID=1443141 RepID=A0ABQ3EC59_9GAMM|nr:hypothetical protein [Salinicola rhizosphaerae]GHB33057.1 hypothetical protein GCM10009038_35040 [Salinicola rhizosphaerae]